MKDSHWHLCAVFNKFIVNVKILGLKFSSVLQIYSMGKLLRKLLSHVNNVEIKLSCSLLSREIEELTNISEFFTIKYLRIMLGSEY